MQTLRKLEATLAEQYEKLPHLPANYRRWIAENAWWVVLVFAIITTIAVVVAIPGIFAIAGFTAAYSSIYQYKSVPIALLITSAAIGIFFGAVSLVLLWMAVRPLKEMSRRGWKLLFVNELISVLSAVIGFIVLIQSFDLFGLIWALLLVAIELYFLFEVRGEFAGAVAKSVRTRASKAVEAEVVEPKLATKRK